MVESQLDEKTKVPLGLVVACLLAFLGGALWINNSLNSINNQLASIKSQLSGSWTAADMRYWLLKMKMENPTLNFPSMREEK